MKNVKTIGLLLLVAVLGLACEEPPGPATEQPPRVAPAPTPDPVQDEYDEWREKLKEEYRLE